MINLNSVKLKLIRDSHWDCQHKNPALRNAQADQGIASHRLHETSELGSHQACQFHPIFDTF